MGRNKSAQTAPPDPSSESTSWKDTAGSTRCLSKHDIMHWANNAHASLQTEL